MKHFWFMGMCIHFGKDRIRLFSERYQGTRGIPVEWHYLFGGRVAIWKRGAK